MFYNCASSWSMLTCLLFNRLICAKADFRGDMKDCYHQACDNIETMLQDDNLQFLGKTVDAIVSTFNTLSEASGMLL